MEDMNINRKKTSIMLKNLRDRRIQGFPWGNEAMQDMHLILELYTDLIEQKINDIERGGAETHYLHTYEILVEAFFNYQNQYPEPVFLSMHANTISEWVASQIFVDMSGDFNAPKPTLKWAVMAVLLDHLTKKVLF